MAQFTSALALMKHQEARFKAKNLSARAMHREIATEGLQDALKLTSGGVGPNGQGRLKWLRSQGHPYGRGFGRKSGKGPRGRAKQLPIGIISGATRRSWRLTQDRYTPQTFSLRNNSKAARYILNDAGTRKMVGRGFKKEMLRRFKARNLAFKRTIMARRGLL